MFFPVPKRLYGHPRDFMAIQLFFFPTQSWSKKTLRFPRLPPAPFAATSPCSCPATLGNSAVAGALGVWEDHRVLLYIYMYILYIYIYDPTLSIIIMGFRKWPFGESDLKIRDLGCNCGI